MEFDEHDDPDEEMEIPTVLPPGYDSSSVAAAARPINKSEVVGGGGGGAPSNSRKNSGRMRYRECLKNHAVNIGGHAVDGCCEFMAAGEEGTIDALKCAACNCHRNFHRKEITDSSSPGAAAAAADHPNYLYHHHHHQNFPGGYYRSPHPPSGYLHVRPLALPGVSGGGREEGEDHMSNPSSSGGGGGGGGGSSSKKRFRTKFTQEQKEKMLAFAESVGWRIQKHDEAAVEQFCAETGVRRQVLKVWMHNNKHTLGKKP